MDEVNQGAKITYIDHSGFLVETAGHYLIFDYYRGILRRDILKWLPDPAKKPLVFVSHSHSDHFNREIFDWRKHRGDIEYVLADGIASPVGAAFVGASQRIQVGDCTVEALESTDEGVAFVVECDGLTVYHAGDLNWWHWEGEGDQENADMALRYKREIDRLKNRRLDIAFVPVDPRLEKQYLWGLMYLMSIADVRLAIPMHFWGDTAMLNGLASDAEALPFRDKIHWLGSLGDSFTVHKK